MSYIQTRSEQRETTDSKKCLYACIVPSNSEIYIPHGNFCSMSATTTFVSLLPPADIVKFKKPELFCKNSVLLLHVWNNVTSRLPFWMVSSEVEMLFNRCNSVCGMSNIYLILKAFYYQLIPVNRIRSPLSSDHQAHHQ